MPQFGHWIEVPDIGSDVIPAANSGFLRLFARNGVLISSNNTSGESQLSPGSLAGSLLRTINITSNYTISNVDAIFANASAGGITVTLPSAISNKGMKLHVRKTDSSSNRVIVTPQSGQTINNASTFELRTGINQFLGITIISNGSGWYSF